MAPSFDTQNLTLDQAAEMLATLATLGYSRSVREKQSMSNGAAGMLIGGGLGLGTGLLSSAMSESKRKQWMRNALLGSLLGAGVGGAVGYGSQLAGSLGEPTDAEKFVQGLRDAKKQEAQAAGNINDPFAYPLKKTWDAVTGSSGAARDWNPEELAQFEHHGLNPGEFESLRPGHTNPVDMATEYAGRPATTLGMGGIGTGLGHLYDRARAGSLDRAVSLNPEELKKLSGPAMENAKSLQSAMAQPGATPQRGIPVPHPTSVGNVPLGQRMRMPYPANWRGPTTAGVTVPPAEGMAGPSNFVGMSPQLRQQMPKKLGTGYRGKAIGGFGGMMLSPLFSRALGSPGISNTP